MQDAGFFIGVPFLLCACMTVAGPYAAKVGYAGAFTYVAMLSFIPWWIAGLTTYVVDRWWGHRLPLWLIAALGALGAGPLVFAYASGVYVVAEAWWPSLPSSDRFVAGLDRWQAFALSEGRSIVLWVAFVTIFAESLGWRRYGSSRAFSSEADTGSRQENASNQESGAPFGFHRNGKGSSATVVVPDSRFQVSGAQWTDEDDFQLRSLVAEGLPPRVIAARMQRTFHAVRARTTKLGLKNNKP